MALQQISLHCSSLSVEPLTDFLFEQGALTVTALDAENEPILEPALNSTPFWSKTKLVALFQSPDTILALLTDFKIPYEVTPVVEKNWVAETNALSKPTLFGNKLWVYPSWCENPNPSGPSLLLDPGLAFGTGSHETTALCLTWAATHNLSQKKVLDYGCGSGILALAALKLRASLGVGIDYDPQALTAARANAKQNGIAESRLVISPSPAPSLKVDIIFANILANTLVTLAPCFLKHLYPGGDLVLSGILKDQESMVRNAYPDFSWVETTSSGDWICIHLKLCHSE